MRHAKNLDVSLGKNVLITFGALIVIFIFGGIISGLGNSGGNNSNLTFSPPPAETISNQKVIITNTPKITSIPKFKPKPKTPSREASFIVEYIFINSTKEERDKAVKLLDKDTNNLVTAMNNMALYLDNNPASLKEMQILVVQNISNNLSRSSGTTLDDLESKLGIIESDLNDIKSSLEP